MHKQACTETQTYQICVDALNVLCQFWLQDGWRHLLALYRAHEASYVKSDGVVLS
jgi:hypothetical protein